MAPVLSMDRIFAEAARSERRKSSEEGVGQSAKGAGANNLLKGVVLDADGKPCRSCTSVANWAAMVRAQRKDKDKASSSSLSSSASTTTSALASAAVASSTSSSSSSSSSLIDDVPTLPADCPPDVDRLGNHTWTLLHGISAAYPERASAAQQADMRGFLSLFGRLYPCWVCADDFRAWMAAPGNAPRVEGKESLGRWMCAAHNEVNRKLGKKEFDCNLWRERWVDGWKDGRCDP